MAMLRFCRTLPLLLLAGCGLLDTSTPVPDVTVSEGASFTLRQGQTAYLDGAPVALTFLARTNEGRCPIGVTCVWEGAVEVRFALTVSASAPDTFLLSGYPTGEEASTLIHRAHGYAVAVERVDPYPVHNRRDREPVTATVRIARDS